MIPVHVVMVCLMTSFIGTSGTSLDATQKSNLSKSHGTQMPHVQNNTVAISDRIGHVFHTTNEKFVQNQGPPGMQLVYLYRGPHKPLQPYFYPNPTKNGQRRSDTIRRTSKNTKARASSTLHHNMSNKDEVKARKVRRNNTFGGSHSNHQEDTRHATMSETKNHPIRIRYDGKPFESIDTFRDSQTHGSNYYSGESRAQHQYNADNQHSLANYDTMPGGIYEEYFEQNRRFSVPVPRKKPRKESRSSFSTSSNEQGTKRPHRSSRNKINTHSKNKYNYDEMPRNEAATFRHNSQTSKGKQRPREKSRFVVMDHYDGGFSRHANTGDGHSYHGHELDYETYEIENRGHYGYRMPQKKQQQTNTKEQRSGHKPQSSNGASGHDSREKTTRHADNDRTTSQSSIEIRKYPNNGGLRDFPTDDVSRNHNYDELHQYSMGEVPKSLNTGHTPPNKIYSIENASNEPRWHNNGIIGRNNPRFDDDDDATSINHEYSSANSKHRPTKGSNHHHDHRVPNDRDYYYSSNSYPVTEEMTNLPMLSGGNNRHPYHDHYNERPTQDNRRTPPSQYNRRHSSQNRRKGN